MRTINEILETVNIKEPVKLDYCPIPKEKKSKVNILALGDVGTTVLIGLRLLGGDVISQIGICDINGSNLGRLEMEINQINYPFQMENLPEVKICKEDDVFDCDVFIFCASKRVPEIGASGDVRMAQLDANREIIGYYGELARKSNFQGLIAVVSDPVDPLCKEMLKTSKLKPSQVQGYGLGVMNARALYYAKKDNIDEYETEGRAFGPHGKDLVIANSIISYNDKISKKLTEKTVTANLMVRDLGYKPYIAPAMSSAAISILLTLRGQWHYGSVYLGDGENGAFLGMKNRITDVGIEYENLEICDQLFVRIEKAYVNLYNIK